jgi:hypothetical protein
LEGGGRSRDPDLSYWGYSWCEKDCQSPAEPGLIPDVVIQFNWKNSKTYEENAVIDDMMNFGMERPNDLVASATRPTLGYLIKVRFSKKRKLETPVLATTTDAITGITTETIKTKDTQDMNGLDIYRLAHGTSIAAGTAVHERYLPGGPEVWIEISAQDLGITDWFWVDYLSKDGPAAPETTVARSRPNQLIRFCLDTILIQCIRHLLHHRHHAHRCCCCHCFLLFCRTETGWQY